MKKIGIITFHNSYNCGSMLESYAIYKRMQQIDDKVEIVDFSSEGQRELYSVFNKNNSVKNILKNILIFPKRNKIKNNNLKYEEFKQKYFKLSKKYTNNNIDESPYSVVVAGSDQIWNITISDFDEAYFLNWVNNAKKVAYAPSFGSKNIIKYSNEPEKYADLLNDFDALSIREKNGKKWIKDLIDKDVDVLIDPTLIFGQNEYDKLLDDSCTPNEDYIFFYCPGFSRDLCRFVKKVSKKYNLPVICWSTKSYCTKLIFTYGFKLPKYESPSVYLSLIKNAKLVFTTSFHGTIFSTIYKKEFYTLKNGGMYGDDDRVITLLEQLNMEDRLLVPNFDSTFDYFNELDYSVYDKKIIELQKKANKYIDENVKVYHENTK